MPTVHSDFRAAYAAWRKDQPTSPKLTTFDLAIGYVSPTKWRTALSIRDCSKKIRITPYGTRLRVTQAFVSSSGKGNLSAPAWLKTAAKRLEAVADGQTPAALIADPWLQPLLKDRFALSAVVMATSHLTTTPLKFHVGQKAPAIRRSGAPKPDIAPVAALASTASAAPAVLPPSPAADTAKAAPHLRLLKARPPKHSAPASAPPHIEAPTPPTAPPTIEQNFAIHDALKKSYPVVRLGYVDGMTDAALAARLHVPAAWIAAERERSFGPADLGPILTARRAAEALRVEITDFERTMHEEMDLALKHAAAQFERALQPLRNALAAAGLIADGAAKAGAKSPALSNPASDIRDFPRV